MNNRSYKNITPKTDNSFYLVRFSDKESSLFDILKTDLNLSKTKDNNVKEIYDFYANLNDCEKDWLSEGICKSDGSLFYGGKYTLNSREALDKDGNKVKPTSNNSSGTIVTQENGEIYKSNINPMDIAKVDKKRDIYLYIKDCLKDWKYEELCEKDIANDVYLSKVYGDKREVKTSLGLTYVPSTENATLWYLLFESGKNYLSTSDKAMSLSEIENDVTASPFKGIETSTGNMAENNISRISGISFTPINTLANQAINSNLSQKIDDYNNEKDFNYSKAIFWYLVLSDTVLKSESKYSSNHDYDDDDYHIKKYESNNTFENKRTKENYNNKSKAFYNDDYKSSNKKHDSVSSSSNISRGGFGGEKKSYEKKYDYKPSYSSKSSSSSYSSRSSSKSSGVSSSSKSSSISRGGFGGKK